MSVIYENIGNELVRAYSDAGVKIHGGMPEGDYDEAIDPVSAGRTYTETEIPVDGEEPAEEDFATAGRILLGQED